MNRNPLRIFVSGNGAPCTSCSVSITACCLQRVARPGPDSVLLMSWISRSIGDRRNTELSFCFGQLNITSSARLRKRRTTRCAIRCSRAADECGMSCLRCRAFGISGCGFATVGRCASSMPITQAASNSSPVLSRMPITCTGTRAASGWNNFSCARRRTMASASARVIAGATAWQFDNSSSRS